MYVKVKKIKNKDDENKIYAQIEAKLNLLKKIFIYF